MTDVVNSVMALIPEHRGNMPKDKWREICAKAVDLTNADLGGVRGKLSGSDLTHWYVSNVLKHRAALSNG